MGNPGGGLRRSRPRRQPEASAAPGWHGDRNPVQRWAGDRGALVTAASRRRDPLDLRGERRPGGAASGPHLVGDCADRLRTDRVLIGVRPDYAPSLRAGADRKASIALRIWWSGSMFSRAAAICRRTSPGSGSDSSWICAANSCPALTAPLCDGTATAIGCRSSRAASAAGSWVAEGAAGGWGGGGGGRGVPLTWFLPSDLAWYMARSGASINSSAVAPSSG